MSTSLKDTQSVPTNKGAPAASAPNTGGNYMPSGLMLATICKALRDAQNADLEIQKDQAEIEQEYYKALGGIGMKDIREGLIAMSADSVAQAGKDEADGLKAQAWASGVNAIFSGATTIGVALKAGSGWNENRNLDKEATKLNSFGKKLNGTPDADLALAAPGSSVDPEIEEAIQKRVPKELEANPDKYNGTRLEAKRQLIDENEKDLNEVRRKQKEISESTQNALNINQAVTTVTQAATQTYSSYEQAQAKINAAADNSAAQVQKQVQDMNSSSANTFKDQARQAATAALQTSDTMAQVAASQVQFRG